MKHIDIQNFESKIERLEIELKMFKMSESQRDFKKSQIEYFKMRIKQIEAL